MCVCAVRLWRTDDPAGDQTSRRGRAKGDAGSSPPELLCVLGKLTPSLRLIRRRIRIVCPSSPLNGSREGIPAAPLGGGAGRKCTLVPVSPAAGDICPSHVQTLVSVLHLCFSSFPGAAAQEVTCFLGREIAFFFSPLLGIKMQEIKAETPVRPVLPAALGAPARWVLLRQQLERISATRCTPWARWVSLVRLPCLWVREAVKDQTRRFRAEHAITKEPLCGCSHKANIVSIYGVAGQSQVFEHPPTTCRAPDATLYISTMLGLS